MSDSDPCTTAMENTADDRVQEHRYLLKAKSPTCVAPNTNEIKQVAPTIGKDKFKTLGFCDFSKCSP